MLLVTQNTIFSGLSANVAEAQNKAQVAQKRASSGLRVNEAADDPVASARGSLLGASLASLASMERASRIAGNNLQASEVVIGQALDVLERTQELTVAAANGSYNAQQRSFIGQEIQVLHDTMLSLANAQNGGVYLFSGYMSTQPFSDDGTYAGDAGVRRVDVAPGLRIDTNLPGSQVFNVAGGENVIGVLKDLRQSLSIDDVHGALSALDRINVSTDQLNQARTTVSANYAQVEASSRKRDELTSVLRRSRAEALEVDTTEALIRMTEAQTAYQTAISAASKVIGQMQNNPLWR